MNIRLVAAAACLLVLSGCATDPGEGPSAPPPTSEASATPTPEPTQAQPAELVLSADGLGPLVVGAAPPVTDPALDVLVFMPEFCRAEFDEGYSNDPGLWVPNYADVIDGSSPQPFGVFVRDGVLETIGIYSSDIETAEGVHLGSPTADVLSAYPDAEVSPGFDTTAYVITGASGALIIETLNAESVATYPEIGSEQVVRLRVTASDSRGALFNSDASWGACVYA